MSRHKHVIISLISGILTVFLFLTALTVEASGSNAGSRPKVVIFILDHQQMEDLSGGGLPNFNKLIREGGLGLMNSRTRSLASSTRAGAYLTLGMGIRTQLYDTNFEIETGPVLGQFSRIRLKNTSDLQKYVKDNYPNYTLGKFGEIAGSKNLKLALVGNSDTDRIHPEPVLFAMDANGFIESASIGPYLLLRDPEFAWGHRTDSNKLLEVSYDAIGRHDIVFIDYGDTFRITEAQKRLNLTDEKAAVMKAKALKEADSFLGRLLSRLDMRNTVLLVISPSPPAVNTFELNKTLTPLIIYTEGRAPGVLYSNTTRRPGLVSNIDIGPTVFGLQGVPYNEAGFLGEEISVIQDGDSRLKVSRSLEQFTVLKVSRYVMHGFYVLLLVSALALNYIPGPGIAGLHGARYARAMAIMVIALPAVSFLMSFFASSGYSWLYLLLTAAIIVALGIVLSGSRNTALGGMAVLSICTVLFLLTDLLLDLRRLHETPLGFNDVFLGGRYYGINNDCMGILLGSAVFSVFYITDKLQAGVVSRTIFSLMVFALAALSFTPGYGANVGGTIAAMITGTTAIMVLAAGKPVKKGHIAILSIVFLGVEIVIAYFDYAYGTTQTHAGKVLGSLINQGVGSKFAEVLESKLRLFLLMLAVPPWNIMLGLQAYIYHLTKRKFSLGLVKISNKFPLLSGAFEVILYGGLVAFVFNDTGVIATALMLTYLSMPLGIMLNTEKT